MVDSVPTAVPTGWFSATLVAERVMSAGAWLLDWTVTTPSTESVAALVGTGFRIASLMSESKSAVNC